MVNAEGRKNDRKVGNGKQSSKSSEYPIKDAVKDMLSETTNAKIDSTKQESKKEDEESEEIKNEKFDKGSAHPQSDSVRDANKKTKAATATTPSPAPKTTSTYSTKWASKYTKEPRKTKPGSKLKKHKENKKELTTAKLSVQLSAESAEDKETKEETKGEKEEAKGEKEKTKGEKEKTKGEKEETKGENKEKKGQKEEAKGEKEETMEEMEETKGEKEETNGEKKETLVDKKEKTLKKTDVKADAVKAEMRLVRRIYPKSADMNKDVQNAKENGMSSETIIIEETPEAVAVQKKDNRVISESVSNDIAIEKGMISLSAESTEKRLESTLPKSYAVKQSPGQEHFKRYNFKDPVDPDGQKSNALEEKTRRKRSPQDDTGIMHKELFEVLRIQGIN